MNKLNPIKYIEDMMSHHPKSISLWITEGIVINDKRYIIKEFRLKKDGKLYAVIAENKYNPKYFEVQLCPDEETLKAIYKAIEDNKVAIKKEITDRKNEITRVDAAIKANTTKINQEITDRKNEINRVDTAVKENTAKINKEIADRTSEIARVDKAIKDNKTSNDQEISRVDKATKDNKALINKEIADRTNEITRVDKAINANTTKINQEITDRTNEITRVDNAIKANTTKIDKEITDRKSEITRLDKAIKDNKGSIDQEITRVDNAIKANTTKINQEITNHQNEINRVDEAINANTTKINQEITDRKSEINRVNTSIESNTTKINKEITDRTSEIARVDKAINKEITDRTNEITRVDNAIKANTTKINQEITDRKNEINRVDKKVEANTAKINQEITDRQNDISRVNEAISANTAKINKEITDRQNEISRVDGKIEANTAKINKEITDRQHEISRVEGKIPTSVGGRNYIKNSEYRKTSINVNDSQTQDEAFDISSAFWQNSNVYAKKIKLSFYYQPSVAYATERKFKVFFRASPWPLIGEVTYPANTTELIKYTIAMTDGLPANFTSGQIFIRFSGNLDKGRDHNISKVMLEVSDVFSDWQPAPEDTVSQISSLSSQIKQTADGMTLLATKTELNSAKSDLQSGITTATNKANNAQSTANSNAQTINTHTTQISALNTGLQAKVSQSEFNTLSGRVTTAENNITAKANELSSKITSVEGKIPTTVGGRNYALKTSDSKSSTAGGKLYDLSSAFDNIADDATLIIEFDWSVTAPTSTSKFRINRVIKYSDGTAEQWDNTIKGSLSSDVSTSSRSGHYSGTFTKVPYHGKAVSSRYLYLSQTTANGTVTISNLSVRVGSLKSDWSPAPEDYYSKLSTLEEKVAELQGKAYKKINIETNDYTGYYSVYDGKVIKYDVVAKDGKYLDLRNFTFSDGTNPIKGVTFDSNSLMVIYKIYDNVHLHKLITHDNFAKFSINDQNKIVIDPSSTPQLLRNNLDKVTSFSYVTMDPNYEY